MGSANGSATPNDSDYTELERKITDAMVYYTYMQNKTVALEEQINTMSATLERVQADLELVKKWLDNNYMTSQEIKNELEKIYEIIS